LGTFFEQVPGATSGQVVTIQNVGVGNLQIDSVSIVGDAAFSLKSDPIADIASLNAADFTVSLATDRPGEYLATVIINSNDLDEGAYSFYITGSVTNLAMVDDGDAGFSTVDPTIPSGWTRFVGQGANNDVTFHSPASGTVFAAWNAPNLTDGVYNVYTTWTPYANRSQAVPYTVFDGAKNGTRVSQAVVNQEISPDNGGDSFTDGNGLQWRVIASAVSVSSGEVTVVMDTALDDYVIADAVLVERLLPLRAAAAAVTGTDAGDLAAGEFDQLVERAAAQWAAVDPAAADLFAAVDVRVSDLPGAVLGLASPATRTIWLDRNAAGYGWHIGMTASEQPTRQFDLISVLSHEFGHLLGLPDLDHELHPGSVMSAQLETGLRRLPSKPAQLAGPFAEPLADRMFDFVGRVGPPVAAVDEPHDEDDLQAAWAQIDLEADELAALKPLAIHEDDDNSREKELSAVDEVFAELFDEMLESSR
ncbi:MAG: hypothetical protein VB835_07755, partial [Pirellulales bacterium]